MSLSMNKLNNYVPIMSIKQGELKAISQLSLKDLLNISPLFDVPRVPIVSGKQSKTLDDHIKKVVINLEKYCKEINFLLDFSLINLSSRMQGNLHPLKYLCDSLQEKNLGFIPTIGLDRDDDYLAVIKDVANNTPDFNLCFRLFIDDLEDAENTQDSIYQILQNLKIDIGKCHLVVDCKSIQTSTIEYIIDLLAEFNQFIPFQTWSSFVLAASSFPSDMSIIRANTNGSIPRVEYDLWSAVIDASLLIGRAPKFGDYCIVNPERAEIDPVIMRAGGKIRYTTQRTWEVFRGHSLQKGEKFAQYRTLSQKVIDSPFYLGKDYSWGDQYILNCAENTGKTGNLTTWVQVDTNHHLKFVGEQISNLSVFSEKD